MRVRRGWKGCTIERCMGRSVVLWVGRLLLVNPTVKLTRVLWLTVWLQVNEVVAKLTPQKPKRPEGAADKTQ